MHPFLFLVVPAVALVAGAMPSLLACSSGRWMWL